MFDIHTHQQPQSAHYDNSLVLKWERAAQILRVKFSVPSSMVEAEKQCELTTNKSSDFFSQPTCSLDALKFAYEQRLCCVCCAWFI